MINDIEILQQIHEELKKIDHPPLDPVVIDFYGRLVDRVPEDGFEQYLPDKELSGEEEEALLELTRYGFLDSGTNHSPSDGFTWHVNLRGKRFLEIANNQTQSVVVGMQDSGKRDTFETGAVRDTAEGKSRPDLISPFATERLGEWLRLGAEKYAERNWEKGIPLSRCLASLHRHLVMYQQGATDEDNMAAILCNAMFIVHIEEMIKCGVLPQSLNDLPKYQAATNSNEQ